MNAQAVPPDALPREETPVDAEAGQKRVPLPPVPSGLAAEANGGTVVLRWNNAGDSAAGSGCKILRHTLPITRQNYTEAEEAGTAAAGVNTFTDRLQEDGAFYYALIPLNGDGSPEALFFVSSENSLVFPVEVSIPDVTDIRLTFFDVLLKNQAVVVRWDTQPEQERMILYRSTNPFVNLASVAQATVLTVTDGTTLSYVDYPVPGVPYYYAAVPEAVIRSGTAVFRCGENTNEIPVEVPGEYAGLPPVRRAAVRAMPLPLLNPDHAEPKPAAVFSAETERTIAALDSALRRERSREGNAVRNPAPWRFPEDNEPGAGGENAALKQILDTRFDAKNWDGLAEDLNVFLSLRRTEEVSARAHFYLGQAYFFTEKYQDALEEFLLSQNAYPNKAREWVQKTLKRL